MEVKERLRAYRKNLARLEYLKKEIEKIEIQIDMLNDALKNATGIDESDDEVIEMLTFRRVLDGLPVPSSFDNSKTERVAMLYKQVQEELSRPPNKQEIKGTIEYLEGLLNRKKKEVQFLELEIEGVKALLRALTQQERFIISKKYIDNQPWWQVTELYNEQFKPARDERTLKNYAENALAKLQKIISA